jgi:predicted DNA-binding WGR domain protein
MKSTPSLPTVSGPLPPTLCLMSIDPTENRYRFYRLSHQRTLWGEEVLVQTWGRLGTDGRSQLQFLEDAEQVQTAMAKLLRRRLQHGYHVTETSSASAEVAQRCDCAQTLPHSREWPT